MRRRLHAAGDKKWLDNLHMPHMDAYGLCSLYEVSHYLFLWMSRCQRRLRCWVGVERNGFVCTSERRRKKASIYILWGIVTTRKTFKKKQNIGSHMEEVHTYWIALCSFIIQYEYWWTFLRVCTADIKNIHLGGDCTGKDSGTKPGGEHLHSSYLCILPPLATPSQRPSFSSTQSSHLP